MSECVGCNEGEGMKEHKQDRNGDGGRQEGTKKTEKKRISGFLATVALSQRGRCERARSSGLPENPGPVCIQPSRAAALTLRAERELVILHLSVSHPFLHTFCFPQ